MATYTRVCVVCKAERPAPAVGVDACPCCGDPRAVTAIRTDDGPMLQLGDALNPWRAKE